MKKIISSLLVLTPVAFLWSSSWASVELIGVGEVSGEARDLSGLTELLEDGTPHDRLGAFGSGVAYTGRNKRYVFLPDRGPADGKTSYRNRFHEFDLSVSGGRVEAKLVQTRLLTDTSGASYIGQASVAEGGLPHLDPEGIRVSRDGALLVSDEYGPFLYEFKSRSGRDLRVVNPPQKFLIGCQTNRGFEGLAITPRGEKILALLQSPLLQDHGLDEQKERIGRNVRMLEVSLKSGSTREFIYHLESPSHGLNEMLAVNDHEFLVLERDGKSGRAAAFKRIFRIDISEATDVSRIEALPQEALPEEVITVKKELFIDLLDPAYGLAGEGFPEKIEGLAFGPDLADGRHLLWVTSDNDFKAVESTRIYAFAVDRDDLRGFEPQRFSGPKRLFFILLGFASLALSFLMLRKRGCTSASGPA